MDTIVPMEVVKSRIFLIRGQKVLLDSDLATLYGVGSKVLNQADLRRWLEQDLAEHFAGRIIPIDAAVAGTWGRMQGAAELVGVKLPVIDALMAASAQVCQMTVVTRNVADFESCGLTVINPWAG